MPLDHVVVKAEGVAAVVLDVVAVIVQPVHAKTDVQLREPLLGLQWFLHDLLSQFVEFRFYFVCLGRPRLRSARAFLATVDTLPVLATLSRGLADIFADSVVSPCSLASASFGRVGIS